MEEKEQFLDLLSAARSDRYLSVVLGDVNKAYDLYHLQKAVAMTSFGIIQDFEVILRNKIDQHLKGTDLGNDWLIKLSQPTRDNPI